MTRVMDPVAEALVAEWDDLRLVITGTKDGWRVYAFEVNNQPEEGMNRGSYASLEAAKEAAFETATDLLGYRVGPEDLG